MATYKDGRRVFGPVEEFSTEETTTSQVLQPDGSGGLTWNPGSGGTGEANTSSNSGAGDGLALAKAGVDLPFKSLTAGSGITLTPSSTEIEIASTGGGGAAGVIEFDVRNDTGAQLDIGTAVSSVAMYSATVYQAVKTDIGTEAHVLSYLGVMTADIANGASGKAYRIGPIENFDTSSWSAGDVLYVSGTAGLLTNVPPSNPVKELIAGKVLTSHATTGSMDAIARQEYNEHVDDTTGNPHNVGLTETTAIKTANYDAAVNEFVRCNVASGGFYVQLPDAPVDGSQIVVQNLSPGAVGSNVLEVKTGGSDHFALTGGPTSLYITLLFETLDLRYDADTLVWTVQHTGAPPSFAKNFPGIDEQTPIGAEDISIDTSTRVLTITPPLGYFNIITDGQGKARRYRKDGNVAFPAFTDTDGLWFFHFDSDGDPTVTQTYWTLSDLDVITPVYRIFWNSAKAGDEQIQAVALETHPNNMDSPTHKWTHLYGAVWAEGLDAAHNAIAVGTPATDGSNTVFALSSGTVIDDNLFHDIANSTGSSLWQQDLGDTTPATLDDTNSAIMDVKFMNGGTVLDTVAGTRFPFPFSGSNIPEYITSTGTRTEVTNNYFFSSFVWCIGDPRNGKFVSILSCTEDFANLTDAQAYTWADIQAAYPLATDGEVRPLYRLIFERKSSYSVDVKYSVLREVQDIRKAAVSSTTVASGSLPASSVTFVPVGDIVATNVQSALQEVDAEKVPLAGANWIDLTDAGDSTLHYHATDRARANHTGTQAASTISDFDTEVGNNTDVAANTAARHSQSHALDSTDHTGTLPESDVAFDNSTGHTHDGTDSTKVDYTDLASIPSTFVPTAHKSAHEAGADGVDPALQVSASGSDGQVLTKGAGTAVGWEDAGAAAAVTVVSGATHTVVLANEVIHVTYTATAAVTVTIDSDNAVDGRSFYIVDAGGNAATYNITIATEGSETINSEVSGLMASDGEAWEIYSDGSNFFVR